MESNKCSIDSFMNQLYIVINVIDVKVMESNKCSMKSFMNKLCHNIFFCSWCYSNEIKSPILDELVGSSA